ncbi:MAG TPA: acyltransferase [Novosphingobium sp.]|nr:acyltransferase [Novosphingobium sp.]
MGNGLPARRFEMLDAYRGIAALAVLFYHAGAQAPLLAPRGYLGADLFFILSGFVLAHAYGARLRGGLGLAGFIRLRLIRIYPMFLMSAVLGALLFHGSPLMLLMLPTPSADGLLFHANAPLWSVTFELLISLGYCLLAPRLGLRGLLGIAAVTGLVLARGILTHDGADLGAFAATAGLGLIRTAYDFTIGVLLHRAYLARLRAPVTGTIGLALPVVLVLVLLVDPAGRAWWDIATIGALFPALVWLGACTALPRPALGERLGGISYPLYCIHAPIVAMCHASARLMGLASLALVVAAWALNRWFDRPLQRLARRDPSPGRIASA